MASIPLLPHTWPPADALPRRPAACQERRDHSFETIVLLAVLFVLNAFDWAFTHSQLIRGNFAEANPFALAFAGTLGFFTYKCVLMLLSMALLFGCRRHWQAEAGAALLVVCYTGLMVWWMLYLDVVEACLHDPAVVAPHVLY